MNNECIAACTKYRAKKVFGISRYIVGQKYCTLCDIFLNWDGMYCTCCSRQLRTRPKMSKLKRKFLEDLKN